MIKVLIVDDEPWALSGISSSYAWEENGFSVIGETTDPENAKQILLNQKPNVIITDICMPGTTGLDLMRLAKENSIDAKFIVISGFSEFHYAQEAIRYGVYAYLLKPLDVAEVRTVINSLKSTNLLEMEKEQIIEVITALIYREELAGKFNQFLLNAGFHHQYGIYQAVIVSGATPSMVKEFRQLPEWKTMILPLGDGAYAFFINGTTDVQEHVRQNWLERCMDAGAIIGIGLAKTSLSKIAASYDEATLALQSSFFGYHENLYVFPGKLPGFTPTGLSFNSTDIKTVMPELLKNIEEIKSRKLGIQALAELYNYVMAKMSKLPCAAGDAGLFEPSTAGQLFRRYRNIEDFIEYLTSFVTYYLTSADHPTFIRDNEQFNQMLQYIDENYSQPIYLKDLSERFYLNSNYICDLFKTKINTTFINYITGKRMKKAADLLTNTNSSIIEVAELIGYGDYSYFIKVFKKSFSSTPSLYRKEHSKHN